MNRNRRNVLIAILLLIFLLVVPFWDNIKGALGMTDTDSGASPESSWTKEEETQGLSSENA